MAFLLSRALPVFCVSFSWFCGLICGLALFSSSFNDKCVSVASTIEICFADFNFDGLIRSVIFKAANGVKIHIQIYTS